MTASIEKVSGSNDSLTKEIVTTLEENYTLVNPYQVLAYLEKHSFLLPVLLEAPAKVKVYFPDAPLLLEVNTDAENRDWQQLVLKITNELPLEQEAQTLQNLWQNWLFTLPTPVRLAFSVDTDYTSDVDDELEKTLSGGCILPPHAV